MLLKFLKTDQPEMLFFIPVFTALVWLYSFIEAPNYLFVFDPHPMPMARIMEGLCASADWLCYLVTALLVILCGLMLIRVNTTFILIPDRSYLPAFMFIFLNALYLPLQGFNPVMGGLIFFILAMMKVFRSYHEKRLYTGMLTAGIYLGLASLFYAKFILFLPVLWIGLIILRTFQWREWVFSFIGLALPYVFIFSHDYLAGQSLQGRYYDILTNFRPELFFPDWGLAYNILFGILAFAILAASYFMLQSIQGFKIYIRKYYRFLFWLFLFTAALFGFFYKSSIELMPVAAIPVSFLLSFYFVKLRNKLWGELLFIFLAGAYVFLILDRILVL